MLPGAPILVATLLVLPMAGTPGLFIALMAGLGFGNGLVSTGAGVLAAQASPPSRRGEALGIYYVTLNQLDFPLGAALSFVLLVFTLLVLAAAARALGAVNRSAV